MANQVAYFFYAPTWDWPPEGPIKLGNVLTSVQRPEQPLSTTPPPTENEVFSLEKKDVEHSITKLRDGNFSLFTKFLNFIGISVDVTVSWEHSNEELYRFQKVETQQFIPKDEYIQKCIETPAVRRFLERSRYRKPVYVITGLKTVYGASAKSTESQSQDKKASIAVDGNVLGGGNVAPGAGAATENKKSTTWEGSSDFVFAFRVRKVQVSRKTQGVKDNDDYTKGAKFDRDDAYRVKEDIPELSILSQVEATAKEMGYREETLMEGDSAITCAFSADESSDDE
ncbi:unnamed protein product [Clonostachys rosea f. rosea IK726]|uniref:Uncharacterized protein n=2 Tax=Bionectria ochroleuca TaxID=29856 RepID=A0A0B7K3U6_BIOOC|nr:unnamed protein product [Clonostachys rosea f. rosea IK726]